MKLPPKVEKRFNKEFEHNETCIPRGDKPSPPWMPCQHAYKSREDIKEFFAKELKRMESKEQE